MFGCLQKLLSILKLSYHTQLDKQFVCPTSTNKRLWGSWLHEWARNDFDNVKPKVWAFCNLCHKQKWKKKDWNYFSNSVLRMWACLIFSQKWEDTCQKEIQILNKLTKAIINIKWFLSELSVNINTQHICKHKQGHQLPWSQSKWAKNK